MTAELDYERIGLMVGLELHQQLNTSRKLFCHCPIIIRDDTPDGTFIRRLRPTQSELGEIDPAALFEFQRKKRFCYEYYNDTTCLVEADEEPPHDMCDEAIDICLTIANFLKSKPVDEIHPMRKIVIDGSNTTGFQRTAVIATGGHLQFGAKRIGIQTICLEEDAARKTGDDDAQNMRIYRLDRLGIPLIEIATAPDIRSPEEAQDIALSLGLLLRSTGRVKRGLGTIRQDVNISIEGGAVVEIKGFQQLDMMAQLVQSEVDRQSSLLKIRDTLRDRGITSRVITETLTDVTSIFAESKSQVIKRAIKSGGVVLAVRLPGFAGLLGLEIQPDRRFGTELSDHAKFWGNVGGIFHTDELPKYGITESDVANLRATVQAGSTDAVVIVAAPKSNAVDALNAVVARARQALEGVPSETRTPLPNASSKFARPRPGAERMYPETDVRPVPITQRRLKRIHKNMPETIEAKRKRFTDSLGLSPDLANQMSRSVNVDLFERLVHETEVPPTLIAVTLENTLVNIHRDGVDITSLEDRHFLDIFKSIESGTISAEAIPALLTYFAKNSSADIKQASESTGLTMMSTDEIQTIIARIVEERADYVRDAGERAVGGLMGVAMKELRGRADGKLVRRLLLSEIEKILG
ncbi:MAG: Glu-tRNA(Gln) amidotransferase subunit GatE [Candidatus Thorarchaeota archaeon]